MTRQKPNLLFVYTDEQAINTLAAYGNNVINMPNLNRLSGQSVVFDQAYVTQPVCTPSRSTLLTGLWPHTNGCVENNIPLKPETQCLPEMADDSYVTAHMGKWHLGNEIYAQHGFDTWVSIEDAYMRWHTLGKESDRSDYHHFLAENGFSPENGSVFSRKQTARLPEEFSKPAFLANRACRFIEENRDNPFILYVNFLEPHMPYFGPRDNQYDPADVILPPHFENPPGAGQPLKTRFYREAFRECGHSGLNLKTESDWRRLIANYWGLCSLVDTHAGRILDSLSENGLDDDTVVVFTSDHGDMMGAHQLIAKCVMFEEAVRVPMFVRLPGQSSMRRVDGPVSQIDLVPSILDLLGDPVPDYLQGQSLFDALMQEDGAFLQRDVFVEWNGMETGVEGMVPPGMLGALSPEEFAVKINEPVRTVVTPEGWKLNLGLTTGEAELYNLNDNPTETDNLASDPAHAATIADLSEKIIQWRKETCDG